MKIIFDENVPLPLRQFFPAHTVTTVQQEGWAGVENGEIIALVDERFDVLLLADKNLRYQQNLLNRKIALVELPTNRWPVLRQIAPLIVRAVELAKPSSYTVVEH
jgi:predicted nuclease of predicted toxin-antitoxin system